MEPHSGPYPARASPGSKPSRYSPVENRVERWRSGSGTCQATHLPLHSFLQDQAQRVAFKTAEVAALYAAARKAENQLSMTKTLAEVIEVWQ